MLGPRKLQVGTPALSQAGVTTKKDMCRALIKMSKLEQSSEFTKKIIAAVQKDHSSSLRAITVLEETRAKVLDLRR